MEAREPRTAAAARNPRAVHRGGPQLDVRGTLPRRACTRTLTAGAPNAQVHGDVFRTPPRAGLLAVYVGTGAQVLACTVVTMAFAVFGFLSPSNRGGAPRAQRDAARATRCRARARARGVASSGLLALARHG